MSFPGHPTLGVRVTKNNGAGSGGTLFVPQRSLIPIPNRGAVWKGPHENGRRGLLAVGDHPDLRMIWFHLTFLHYLPKYVGRG